MYVSKFNSSQVWQKLGGVKSYVDGTGLTGARLFGSNEVRHGFGI